MPVCASDRILEISGVELPCSAAQCFPSNFTVFFAVNKLSHSSKTCTLRPAILMKYLSYSGYILQIIKILLSGPVCLKLD